MITLTWWQKANPCYLLKQLKTLSELSSRLTQENSHLTRSRKASDERELNLSRIAQQLQADNDVLKAEVSALKATLDKREKDYETLKKTNLTLVSQKQKLKLDLAKLEDKVEQVNATASHLAEMYEEIRVRNKQRKADNRKLKMTIKRLTYVNDLWFKTALGYSKDDSILLNRSLWGKKIEMVEYPNELSQ